MVTESNNILFTQYSMFLFKVCLKPDKFYALTHNTLLGYTK